MKKANRTREDDKRKRKEAFKRLIIDLLKEIIFGVIVGLVVAAVSNFFDERDKKQEMIRSLSLIHVGESYEYIKGVFGIPVINVKDGELRDTYYGLEDVVLRCVYDSGDSLVAYFVTVNEKKLYEMRSNIFMDDAYLLDFTYYEFANIAENVVANMPANNEDYAYYRELYYGAGPEDYNYILIGSHMDYHHEETYGRLLSWYTDSYYVKGEDLDHDQLNQFRKKLKPNTYGYIKEGYEEELDIISFSESVRDYGRILYDRWH